MITKDFLTFAELNPEELAAILTNAAVLKNELKQGYQKKILEGKSVALIFEKPSTRTRISFEVGLYQLGANPIVLNAPEMQLGRGETIEDTGKVIARYCDAIVIRAYEQAKLEALAGASPVPVVNALSDSFHPCQALADLLTIQENRGTLAGQKIAYLGDGNNVLNSLLYAAATAGMEIAAACPKEFSPDHEVVERARSIAASTGGSVQINTDAMKAAKNADVLYTDVWVSMGDEGERTQRMSALRPYRIDEEVVSVAKMDALIMHCLPAHRGEEIEGEILDGPNSVVLDQAENRLHAQKALMVSLLNKEDI